MMPIRIAVIALIMTAFCIESYAASFDCRKAKSRAEILVCTDAELSSLDDDLGKIYAQAKALAPSPVDFKAQGEREWKKRETTCVDKQCLLAWYSQRRDQLMAVINTQTAKPQPPLPLPAKDSAVSTPKPSTAAADKSIPPVTAKPQPPLPLPAKDSAVSTPKPSTAAADKSIPPATSSSGQKTYQIAGAGYYGCTDKENFKRLRDILMQRDDAAFLQEVTASVTQGACVRFYRGQKVSLEEGTGLSSVIRIRREGSPNAYWTTPKAILIPPEK